MVEDPWGTDRGEGGRGDGGGSACVLVELSRFGAFALLDVGAVEFGLISGILELFGRYDETLTVKGVGEVCC